MLRPILRSADMARFIAALCLILVFFTALCADTVYLRNGQVIEGEISDKGGQIEIQKDDGAVVLVERAEIERI